MRFLLLFFLFNSIIHQVFAQTQTYETHFKSGSQKMAEEDYKRAIVEFTIAIEIEPHLEAFISRALAKQKINDLEGALEDYDEAITMDSSNAVIFNNRGNIRDELKRPSEAVKDYNKALSIDSVYTNAFYNRAIAKFSLKDFEGAKTDFIKVTLLSPKDGYAFVGLGLSESRLGNKEATCIAFLKAKELNLQGIVEYLDKYCK